MSSETPNPADIQNQIERIATAIENKTAGPGKPKLFIGTDEVQIRKDHVISIYMGTPDANGLRRIGFCVKSPDADYQRDHTEPMAEADARALFAEFTKELNRAW